MSLPAKTGLSLALKLKNGYPAMGGGEESRFYTIFDPGYVDTVKDRPILTAEALNLSYYNNLVDNANAVIASASDASGIVQLGADGLTINLTGYTGTLNGSPIASGATQITTGIVNTLALTASVDTNLRYIATDLTNNSSAIIFNVSGPNFDIPLDTDSLTIARETLNEDGEELSTLQDVSSDGTEGTFAVIEANNPSTPTTEGVVYKVIATVSGINSGAIGWTCGGNSNNYTEDGVYEEIITAAAGTTVVRTGVSQPNSGATLSLSIKETTDAQYINVQAEDKVQELP